MPYYVYRCEKCNAEYNKIIKMAKRNNQICDCGEPLSQTIGTPTLIGADTVSREGGHYRVNDDDF